MLSIDHGRRTVTDGNQVAYLTVQECRLLDLLNSNRTKTVSKEEILRHLYGEDNPNIPAIKIIDVLICKIRRKLPGVIETIWGRGYAIAKATAPKRIARKPSLLSVPEPGLVRWTPQRKQEVIEAVSNGVITAEDACKCYNLTTAELFSWCEEFTAYGRPACAPLIYNNMVARRRRLENLTARLDRRVARPDGLATLIRELYSRLSKSKAGRRRRS